MAFPEWYDDKFGPHTIEVYRDELRLTEDQITSLKSFIGEPSELPVLDLCCGWGRHSLPLARAGYRVVGLDGSKYFMEKAAADSPPASAPVAPSFVRGDMRLLPFAPGSFRACYQMYTSFGYGTEAGDDQRVLGEVRRVLAAAGIFLMDLINWTLARKAFRGKFEQSYPAFELVERCNIERCEDYDLLRVNRALLYNDGRTPHLYDFEIRMYERDELAGLFERAGFEVLDVWGSFAREPYRPERSYRMILIARREAG